MRRGDRDRRPRARKDGPRTVVPPFDPADLASSIEAASVRQTDLPTFDAYSRIVEERLSADVVTPAEAIETVPAPAAAVVPAAADPSRAPTEPPSEPDVESLARAMYSSYLASEFPEALTLGEHVIDVNPDHALAQAVVSRCRAVLGEGSLGSLLPSSILRLRPDADDGEAFHADASSMLVLRHVDGITDAATVAELSGLGRREALDHLHSLLDAGVLELVG